MQEAAPDEESNVSPEEQAQYDTFVTNGMTMMYDEKVLPQIMEALKGDGNPIEGLANATAMIVLRLDDSAEQSGQQISGEVKFHGATELLEQLAELSQEAGIHEFNEEDMEAATYLAMDIYRTTRQEQGKLPKEDLEQDMQELMALNESGQLDQEFPGLSEHAAKRSQPGQEEGPPPESQGLMRKG
jgi:hypothetical protein